MSYRQDSSRATARADSASAIPKPATNKKVIIVQVFLSFTKTPFTPILVRVSDDITVDLLVEKALEKYTSALVLERQTLPHIREAQASIPQRTELAVDEIPSHAISDYLIRVATGDGHADPLLQPLRHDLSLSAQQVIFPYMINVAIDPYKPPKSLSLTPAYRAALAAEARAAAAALLPSAEDSVGGASSANSTRPADAAAKAHKLAELAAIREANVDIILQKRREREQERLLELDALEVQRREAAARKAAAAAEATAKANTARKRLVSEELERFAASEESLRDQSSPPPGALGNLALTADNLALTAALRQRSAAVAAARDARLEKERQEEEARLGKTQEEKAAAAARRVEESVAQLIHRIDSAVVADAAQLNALESQQQQMSSLMQRQLHEIAVVDLHRRDHYAAQQRVLAAYLQKADVTRRRQQDDEERALSVRVV